ncbi:MULTISPECIES: hypothetical protein [Methanosarcina]|nr:MULTISPECIES: hypothetical protein [Methanosarcina]
MILSGLPQVAQAAAKTKNSKLKEFFNRSARPVKAMRLKIRVC